MARASGPRLQRQFVKFTGTPPANFVTVQEARAATVAAFSLDSTTTPGTAYLALKYRQYAAETGITINVQTTRPETWTTVVSDLSRQIGTDPVTGDPLIKVGVKTTGLPKEFIRLNVDAVTS